MRLENTRSTEPSLLSSVEIDSGTREVQIAVAGSSTNVVDLIPTFLADNAYTFVTFGAVGTASGTVVNDTLTVDPGAGMFALRVINGASNNAGIDVYVTSPGEDLNTVSPSISGVAYGTTSVFVNLPAGNRQIRVTAANSKQVIYDAPAQMKDLLVRMWPIAWSHYPKGVHDALMETLHIATLGTILAVAMAIPVGVLAASDFVALYADG